MKETRRIAICGMMIALCVVLLLLGTILDLGMYAAPLFAGLCLIPVGRAFGRKYHLILYLAVSLLSLLLVPNIEENLMFFTLFGCYPIIRPWFHRFPKWLMILLKLLYFNVVVVAVEALVMLVLVPESLGTALNIVLLVLGNLTFVCYDFLVPRSEIILAKYLDRIKKSLKK